MARKLAEMKRKGAETPHVFSEQIDRNVRPWLRKAWPNVETPVQPNKTVVKGVKNVVISDTTNANICS